MDIKRSGSQPSGVGPAEWFTGTVRVDPLFQAPDPARVSGANVTFSPLSLTGACVSEIPSVPLGDATISTTGSIGNTNQSNISVPSCGFYNATASGGFFGRSFQFSVLYTVVSASCLSNPGNFSFSGTLSH